jgi:hypothetical protein
MEIKLKDILLVVAGGGIAYYILSTYQKRKNEQSNEIEPTPTPVEESKTTYDEVVVRPFPIVKYKVIEPISVQWGLDGGASGTKTFNVGDIVITKRKSAGTLVTYTTLEGKAPDFEMVGQFWLELPLEKLEEVEVVVESPQAIPFTGVDNFFKGHSQNCSGLNCV